MISGERKSREDAGGREVRKFKHQIKSIEAEKTKQKKHNQTKQVRGGVVNGMGEETVVKPKL